uniref:hypothetical protein n=1 Tax=Staphylococcaceae TaxID=90964 RepID=UPI001331520F|nr:MULTISPECIES: hypothetical protein [Staphylococcaceae]
MKGVVVLENINEKTNDAIKYESINRYNILTRTEEDKNMKIAVSFGEDNNFWFKNISKDKVTKKTSDSLILIDDETQLFYELERPVNFN